MAPPEITAAIVLAKVESLLAITRGLISSLRADDQDTTSSTSTVTAATAGSTEQQGEPDDPFKALVDAPTVLRAQATKLGLMLVNKPLAPLAVHGILTDVDGRILPTLVAAGLMVLRRVDIYGQPLTVKLRLELMGLLEAVVLLGEDTGRVFGAAGIGASKDDVMVTVGKLFAECDGVVEIAQMGVVKTAAARAKDWIDLFQDGIGELGEWREKVIEDRLDDEDDPFDSDNYLLKEDEKTGSEPERPPREELLASVTSALTQASLAHKLTVGAYKRRIRKFPFRAPPYKTPEDEQAAIAQMKILEQILQSIEESQDAMDLLAIAFYTFRMDSVAKNLQYMTEQAHALAEAIDKTWDGKRDDFSDWVSQWRRLFDGTPPRVIQHPENSLDTIITGVAGAKLEG
jgi:hypothetical protein